MTHTCHVPGCGKAVSPKLLMCGKHWRMVPLNLRMPVYRYYVKGQEVRRDPSREYLAAAKAAISSVVAQSEQKTQMEIEYDPN